jgi:hypothetical protein
MSSLTASTAAPEPTPTPVPGPTSSPALPRSDAQPCTIGGTEGNDVLVGTPGPDVICGLGGDDLLQGLDGDDVLEGGDGVDTATWETSPCCIRADLAVGSATGAGTDRLVGIENLTGSPGDDVLRGDAGSNALSGLGGTDLLYGGDGDDVVLGGDGDDYLAGEGGAAAIDGGEGADVCAEGIGASCYPVAPPDPNDTRGILDVRLVATALGASPSSWRIATFGRASKRRLWDEGYFVVSFDSKGDPGYDFHVVAKATRGRMRALLLRQGSRAVAGIVRAGRPTNRSTAIQVPLDRLEIPAERAYYRWSVRTLFTGTGCPPCLDIVPAEGEGAFPQPVPA